MSGMYHDIIDLNAGGYNMPRANKQMQDLYVDFKGMENLENIINTFANKLLVKNGGLTDMARRGQISMYDYDMQLAEFIRVNLGKQLGIVRNIAMRKARNGMKGDIGIGRDGNIGDGKNGDIGAASGAVMRRNYKDRLGGNINIASPGKRMSSRQRKWEPGKIKKRDHTDRTAQINRYYGPDRAFILRILEVGRDSFMAESGTGAKGPGSRATWGRRGAMTARGFFHTMSPDMERAAQRMGQEIETFVEKLLAK